MDLTAEQLSRYQNNATRKINSHFFSLCFSFFFNVNVFSIQIYLRPIHLYLLPNRWYRRNLKKLSQNVHCTGALVIADLSCSGALSREKHAVAQLCKWLMLNNFATDEIALWNSKTHHIFSQTLILIFSISECTKYPEKTRLVRLFRSYSVRNS